VADPTLTDQGMLMRTLSATIVAALAFSLGACKQESPKRLTEANVREAIAAMNAASAKLDAAAICNMIDESASINLKEIKFSGPETVSMTRDQYCGFIAAGMAAMKSSGVQYETSTTVEEITLSADGATGEVRYSQADRMVAGGQVLQGSFAGNSTLAWRDGRVMVTSVRGVVRVAQ